ncbi:MAG TPA: hypothetical protein VN133_05045 [Humibacter sp.]|jgi:hypothetical protein|nr:hypothetical protein [Humibacter sp.]
MTNDRARQAPALDRQQKSMGNVAEEEALERGPADGLDSLQTAMGSAAQSVVADHAHTHASRHGEAGKVRES